MTTGQIVLLVFMFLFMIALGGGSDDDDLAGSTMNPYPGSPTE